jgi:hypothetical protein
MFSTRKMPLGPLAFFAHVDQMKPLATVEFFLHVIHCQFADASLGVFDKF